MHHRDRVPDYPRDLAALAAELADLRYDALAGFLAALAAELAADAAADAGRGRPLLAGELDDAAAAVSAAAAVVDRAWALCAPHMPPVT